MSTFNVRLVKMFHRFCLIPSVHLPHIHAVVTAIGQILHPRMAPAIRILEDARCMGIVPSKEAGARRRAGRSRNMAVGEGDPLIDQPIQIRRIHVGKAQRVDRIKALLVGDD